ncbi:hypothetical protein SFRURICE_020702 [Spodoptera frugiperda]|nr:hypothetical protein SFRURICE_020702 [Spodoptera frugiperda]
MDNTSLTPCQIHELYQERFFTLHVNVLDVEQGSVIYSKNETSFWTAFTLACSTVGISLSAAALGLLILTAALFAEWRQSYKNQLLIQFMLARFLYACVRFFSDVQKVFKVCPFSNQFAFVDVISLMYTEMALVTWMFIFSRQIYISLVRVFVTEKSSIIKVSIIAWLGPAVLTTFLFGMFYRDRSNMDKYFFFYILTIKWPTLIANAVYLILALRSVIRNNMKTEKNVRIIVVMIMLIFIFCFQQMVVDVFKMIYMELGDSKHSINNMLKIGNLLSMYHCACSILFWVLGNANTRKLWRFHGKGLRVKLRLSISS